MSPSLRRRRLFKQALVVWLVLLLVGGATLTSLWKHGILKRWAQARIVEYFLKEVQPHLPFRIEELEVDGTWRELLVGHISRVSTVLHWDRWRIRLSGPIEITRPDKKIDFYAVKFLPRATIEPDSTQDPTARSSSVNVNLYVRATQNLKALTELEAFAEATAFEWKHFGIESKHPNLAAVWQKENAEVTFSVKSLNWKQGADHLVNCGELSLSAHTALKLKPLEVGPEIHFQWEGKSVEALWETLYLDIPLALAPGQGQITLGQEPSLKLDLGLVSEGITPLRLEGTLHHLRWKTASLPIQALVEGVKTATGSAGPFAFLNGLRNLDFRGGTIQTEGKASFSPGKKPQAEGILHLQNGALQIKKAAFAARGVRADLPFSTEHGAQGIVSADDVYFRKLHGKLAPTDISAEAIGRDVFAHEGLKLRLGAREGRGNRLIPLTIDGIPLELGTITGRVPAGPEAEGEPYSFESSLKLPETETDPVLIALCLGKHRIPAAKVSLDISRIQVNSNDIDPDGEVRLRVFDGLIQAKEIGMYDLRSDVPEVDFNMIFSGLRLDELGEWSGFGDMTGMLQGFAHDVTFQRWLPTHFDFSIDAVPTTHAIEFSPEAMKNLVSLFAGDALDHVPDLIKGTVFGTFFGNISHRLGGFDVQYAGLSLFSNEGTIMLETHDLPDVYYIFKKHYIFWGHRFKMPLESEQYPVIMNESGLARVTQLVMAQIQSLAQRNAEKKAKLHPELVNKEPQNEAASTCLPPAF